MKLNLLSLVSIFVCIVSFTACTGSGGDSDDPGSGDSSLQLSSQTLQASANGSGIATFNFSLPAGSSSFQLFSSAGTLTALNGPQGDLLNAPGFVSSFQLGAVSNVAYYGPSISGGSYTASYNSGAGAPVTLRVFSKGDANPSGGTLKLNVVLLGPVANSREVLDALDEALEVSRIIYGRAGITLDTAVSNAEGPGTAPEPGDPLYQSILSSQRSASVTVVLASERRGRRSGENQYGTAGSIPYPILPNPSSIIVVSIQDVTGGDGLFDSDEDGSRDESDDERRLLGEEISRFTAQALGLRNIVDFRGNDASVSDDLPDSPSCLTETACKNDGQARTNLMYPEPLERRDEDKDPDNRKREQFYPRDRLTLQQERVLNNSVFVD